MVIVLLSPGTEYTECGTMHSVIAPQNFFSHQAESRGSCLVGV